MYLNCHTWYSMRYGTMSVKELCEEAKRHVIDTLTVTDINSTTACLSFIKEAKQYGIKPLVGIDFRNNYQQVYVGIAKSNTGYLKLNNFLSHHLREKLPFPEKAPALSDCYFIYPIERYAKSGAFELGENEWIGVSFKAYSRYKLKGFLGVEEKLVALQSVTLRHKKDYNAHRLLRAIDNNTLLSKLPKEQCANEEDKMHSWDECVTLFEEHRYILENTKQILDSCHVDFEFNQKVNRNLQIFGNSKAEDEFYLRELCYANMEKRYANASRKVKERVEKELEAIIGLGFVSYFLINYDIIQYARSKKYSFIGRGSGANSVVAYILGITNVDPIELDLYFERFINSSRSSPPDFDLDFSWKDREDITNYIFERYAHTALMGTYVTFKRKAVVRELGKVFGLPKENIDRLASGFFQMHQLDELEKLVLKYGSYIEGFPNYVSVHSGGILILDQPIQQYAATFFPPKGFPTIQIDMHIAEDVGIHKFDILAQRGLSKITDAIQLIKENQPKAIIQDIEDVQQFKTDPKINSLLAQGDCMGVFYVESPAMRGLLTKLQTDNYLNLVAASSIIRPGVSSAGMKEEFIKRHRNPEKRKEAHPILYKIMPDTYGVMVYQEDVMKVAHHFAGLELDDADVLRRGMSGKKTSKGQMETIETKFRKNCKTKGYREDLVNEIWTQISSFAGYAFPKGHSASYAVESYQSLYLKCYFPLEFMVAVINNGGGFYSLEIYLQEIRNCGGTVYAPCINQSDYPTTIRGKDIFLGMGYLKELEIKTVQIILENRAFYGNFKSLENFIDRVKISVEQIGILIKVNAFRFTEKDKHQLLWEAHFLLQKNKQINTQPKLFNKQAKKFMLPAFSQDYITEYYDQLQVLGLSLIDPFLLLKEKVSSSESVYKLKERHAKSVTFYGYLITAKRTSTSKGEHMFFGTFYNEDFQIFDTVHFPQVASRYPLRSKGIYKCIGKVAVEFDYPTIIVESIVKMEVLGDTRFVSKY